MIRHFITSSLVVVACLLSLSVLVACKSITPAEQIVTEQSQPTLKLEVTIDWLQEAQQATSIDAFILALVSMMDTGLTDEIGSLYRFTDSKGVLITPERWQKARMILPCPMPDDSWIYLSNYQVADVYHVNFRIENNSGLFWCAMVVGATSEQYVIVDMIDYKTNISVKSSLEAQEILPAIEFRTASRITRLWGVRELLSIKMSLSEFDQLINKNHIDQNNPLIKTARARLIARPVSLESMVAYTQIITNPADQNDWPLQQFYQYLGWRATEEKLMQRAENFTRLTGDAVWPYVFWSRVAMADKDNELSERLLQIALFNDPLNELPYFALMRTYAQQKEYGHLLEVRSLLESKFDYRIEPTYFMDRPVYDDFVLSESFKNWANQH